LGLGVTLRIEKATIHGRERRSSLGAISSSGAEKKTFDDIRIKHVADVLQAKISSDKTSRKISGSG
jgi:hypothetical protein